MLCQVYYCEGQIGFRAHPELKYGLNNMYLKQEGLRDIWVLKFGVFAYAGYCILYYYAGVLVGKVGESLWMSSVCVPKMGQLRTWMTDCSTELVLLLKIGQFSGSIC